VPDPVERFRKLTGSPSPRDLTEPSRKPVPPREWALVALLLITVLWLIFSLGGVRLWGEMTALFLSIATLFLLPRWKNGELEAIRPPVYSLLRLPLFWFGFGLYAYMSIQSWNLAWDWTVIPDGRPRLISTAPLVSWLPTGLESPFDESNPLRSMVYFAIPWLACSAAWAGLSTRRSVSVLLHGLAFAGIAFAFIALRQHFLGSERILGIFETVPSRQGSDFPFYGTLINGNHAAFYLILANGLCLGLFLSSWHQAIIRFRSGGGAWMLYLGFAFLTSFAVLIAQARAAIIFLVLQWIIFLIICSFFFIRHFGARGTAFPVAVVILFLSVTGIFIGNPAIFERQKQEWTRTFDLVENPEMEARYYMMQITWDMIGDKPWYGHGAGGFRYLHFPYKAAYPEFVTERPRWLPNPITGKREKRTYTVWFQNAHVDLLEYVVEWGIIGCLFPAGAILWLLGKAVQHGRAVDAGVVTILASAAIIFLGAAVEFHFRVPLVLFTWCLSLTATLRFVELRAR